MPMAVAAADQALPGIKSFITAEGWATAKPASQRAAQLGQATPCSLKMASSAMSCGSGFNSGSQPML